MNPQTNTNAPWTTWWQIDLPCLFSQERAAENCKYLIDSIGGRWLSQSTEKPGAKNHPLLDRWLTNGACSFLELNLLAEDLRILDGISGIEIVIEDLRDAALCLPTWHMLHSAALFERKIKGAVRKFFPQVDKVTPDFLLSNNGYEIPVEAKLLTKSESEEVFEGYAENLSAQLQAEAMNEERVYPTVTVICKDVAVLPKNTEVIESVKQHFRDFNGDGIAV